MLLTLTLPVLGLLPIYPELYHATPQQRESAYGLLLKEFLPTGLLGLALAAMAAAVMSTIASHLNFGAQTIVNDIVRTFHPKMPEQRSILMGRISMIIIMFASILVVYNSTSLIGIAVRLIGLFAATASIAWGQWWWWRTNFPAWISAMVVGPIIYVALGFLLQLIPGWQEYAAQGATAAQALDMLQAIIGMFISLFTWIAVALATKPEDMETLKKFYKRAQPMGLWGPVRAAIVAEEGEAALPTAKPMIARGLAFSLLGTSWIGAAVLSLSKLYVGAWGAGIGFAVASVILALFFAKAFDNYHRLLGADAPEEGTTLDRTV
jgi:Na+/proline symporter